MEELMNRGVATLLVSLRIAPALAFSPPFTLLRIPATVRLVLTLALAAWLVAANPLQTSKSGFWAAGLFTNAAAELLLGIALALPLQMAFAALLTAGRALDIQAGFGLALLKEALKSILKMAAYTTVAVLAVKAVIAVPGRAGVDAHGLAGAMHSSGMKLLFLFILLALFFAAIDQIIVRKEFTKQMRMSRREVTRESKEREGEPRMKQKRKQLHAEFVKQSQGLGNLPGSDLVVVNPEHFAVALSYDASRMAAPEVRAKGRNNHALMLKRQAFRLGIPIYENPPLARALYQGCEPGGPVGPDHYRAIADLYLKLHRAKAANQKNDDAQQDDQQE